VKFPGSLVPIKKLARKWSQGLRPTENRWTATHLRVQMRPDGWATWTEDERRKWQNARKRERRVRAGRRA